MPRRGRLRSAATASTTRSSCRLAHHCGPGRTASSWSTRQSPCRGRGAGSMARLPHALVLGGALALRVRQVSPERARRSASCPSSRRPSTSLEAGAYWRTAFMSSLRACPPKTSPDEGDGLARRGWRRPRPRWRASSARTWKRKLPALRVVVDRHALHLQRADLGQAGTRRTATLFAAAGGGGGQAGGRAGQVDEVVGAELDVSSPACHALSLVEETRWKRTGWPRRAKRRSGSDLGAGFGAAQHRRSRARFAALQHQEVAARRAAANARLRPRAARTSAKAAAPRATARSGASLCSTRGRAAPK